jgi:hypothetical protein
MSQLFPRYANSVARGGIAGLVLAAGVTAWASYRGYWSPYTTQVGTPRDQPVPFSHRHHVGGLGIDCRYCHTGVETSSFAGIPPTETCMTCHSQVWRDAPVLEPVRASWRTGVPLQWTRVNDLPDYVYFNHSIHVQKGVGCVSCHGRVDEMPLMTKAESLYMRWCLDCHREPEKQLRARTEVFAMTQTPPAEGMRGADLVGAYHIQPERLSDCSICHR